MPRLAKPENCKACVLRDSGTGFCPDAIAPHVKYLCIAEAPGKTEIAQGKPLVGKAGYVFHNWLLHSVPLLKVAYERGEMTLSNVLRCLPKETQGRAYPRGAEKTQAEATCRQYDHPSNQEAHTVILFGEHAQRLFFGAELQLEDQTDKRLGHDLKGVMGRIGRVYDRDQKRWVFCVHPAAILRQPALVVHGQAALRIAANQERMVEVDYVPWETAMGSLS